MAEEKIDKALLSEAKKKWGQMSPEAQELWYVDVATDCQGFLLLWDVVKRIEETFKIDVKGILREERWKHSFAYGQELAKKYKKHGIKELYDAYSYTYEGRGHRAWFELNDQRAHWWVLECPLYKYFKEAGRTDEEIREMAPFYCFQDEALMKGFNPNFEVAAPTKIMAGDDHCTYIVEDHGGKAEPIPEGAAMSPEGI